MRLPRVRFTVRGMMVAVAIVAAIPGVLVERRARFGRIALDHNREIVTLGMSDLEMYLFLTATQQGNIEASPSEKEAFAKAEEERSRATRLLREFIEYHGLMGEKYQRASDRPWLPVASDPPPPARPSKEYLKALFATIQFES